MAVAAAVLGAGVRQLNPAHLSVPRLLGSATTEEWLSAAVIDAPHIAAAAGALVDGRRKRASRTSIGRTRGVIE